MLNSLSLSTWIPNPPPLEEVDPELGELLRLFCNGELKEVPIVGRNDPCPCKSGLKFKKCHGRT
jgi:uncharacterized protein YecA (UPF0149 family)